MKDFILAYDIPNLSTAQTMDDLLSRAGFNFTHIHSGDLDKNESLSDRLLSSNQVALLFISDNFLKSRKCMLRGMHSLQELVRTNRCLPIIIDGIAEEDGELVRVPTSFERVSNVIQYMNFWQEEYLELRKLKRKVQPEQEEKVNNDLSVIRSISTEIGEYLRFLRGVDHFTFEQVCHEKFKLFFEITGNEASYPNYARTASEDPIVVEEKVFQQNKIAHTTPVPAIDLSTDHPSAAQETIVEEEPETEASTSEPEVSAPIVPQEAIPPIVEEEIIIDAPEEDMTTNGLQLIDEKEEEEEKEELGEREEDTNDFENGESPEAILQSIFDDDDEEDDEDEEDETEKEPQASNNGQAPPPEFIEEEEDEDEEMGVGYESQEERIELSVPANSSIETIESMLESALYTNPEPTEEEALELIEKGEITAGLEVMKQLLDLHPEDTKLRLIYAGTLLQQNDQAELAKEELETILTYNPKESRAYLGLGELAEKKNDFENAKKYYERAAKYDKDIPGLLYKLGMISMAPGIEQPKEAAQYFKKALKSEPENVDAHYRYGLLQYERLENPKKAIKYFQKTLALYPDHPFANYDLALIYYHMGEPAKAAAFYHESYQINPELKTPDNDKAFSAKTPHDLPDLQEEISMMEEDLELDVVQKEEVAAEVPAVAIEEPPTPLTFKGTVLITGATSGIGKATATLFAQNGYRLILTGRRQDRLEALEQDLQENFPTQVYTLDFDVRDLNAVKEAITSLPKEWMDADILINNAGLASGFAPIHQGNIDDWERMIDTNVKGLLYMTRAISPRMVDRRKGHIINICSIAGYEVYPNGNVYCATKHAVDALTKSMRLDLHKHNIRVSQVSPAHVEATEFALVRFHGDQEKARIYEDFQPLMAQDVAEVIYFMATRPPHVNVQDVVMMGTQQANSVFIDRSGRSS